MKQLANIFLRSALRLVHICQRLTGLSRLPLVADISVDTLFRFVFIQKSFVYFDFDQGRTSRGYSFQSAQNKDHMYIFLENYLFRSQPQAISRLARLSLNDATASASEYINCRSFTQQGLPAWAITFPWEARDPYKKLHYYPQMLLENRYSHLSDASQKDTCKRRSLLRWTLDDMVEVATSHGRQFTLLYKSMLRHGYQISMPHPSVYVLRKGREWCWVMAGEGNHRAYVSHMLGYKIFAAQVLMVVDFAKVEKWPNVANGVYSVDEAIKVFDDVFSGEGPVRGVL